MLPGFFQGPKGCRAAVTMRVPRGVSGLCRWGLVVLPERVVDSQTQLRAGVLHRPPSSLHSCILCTLC
jgi:hypothetical protein